MPPDIAAITGLTHIGPFVPSETADRIHNCLPDQRRYRTTETVSNINSIVRCSQRTRRPREQNHHDATETVMGGVRHSGVDGRELWRACKPLNMKGFAYCSTLGC